MPKTRVLIVDDSVLVRRLMTDVLYDESEIEIAGTAANGKIALSMISQVNPDVVTMDVEMPEMNGIQALTEIRKTHPRLPVIMVSSHTEQGAAATIDALTCGANDYIAKPSRMGSMDAALEYFKAQLIPKIKQLTRPLSRPLASSVAGSPVRAKPSVLSKTHRIDIVAIGVSTGGPNALAEVIPKLPANFPVPIVIVQHMPATFTRLLAERLGAKSLNPVHEGAAGQVLGPKQIWIAPGDYHMIVGRQGAQRILQLHQGPPENSCRPAVDVLFRSVADVYGANCLAVVMTGMGQDGLRGSERIRELGGSIFAQDEASSVVWGMPGFIVQAGLADKVLPLDQLAHEISRRAQEKQTVFLGKP